MVPALATATASVTALTHWTHWGKAEDPCERQMSKAITCSSFSKAEMSPTLQALEELKGKAYQKQNSF